GWSDARPDRRRIDRLIFSLARDLFRQRSHWPDWFVHGLSPSTGLSRGAHESARCSWAPSVRLRYRTAFVCARSIRRTHAERTRNSGDAGSFRPASGQLWISCHKNEVSVAASEPVSRPHVSRGGERQLFHAARYRR